MGVLSKGTNFSNGDQVTDTSLDNLVDNATFTTSAVDEVSTDIGGSGSIIVKDGGITTGKLADSTSAATGVTSAKIASSAVTAAKIGTGAVTTVKILDDNVTTAKILDANVTKAKIENLTDYTVLGNVSGGAAAPAEVTILDEDTLVTDSATALATQQSIKAYVDAQDLTEYALKYSGSTGTISATATFADWDLSAIVGVNRAMVIIELWDSTGSDTIMLRTKGSSVQKFYANNYPGWGTSGIQLGTADEGGTLIVVTDASGVIEIQGHQVASGINYKIQAYQKLA